MLCFIKGIENDLRISVASDIVAFFSTYFIEDVYSVVFDKCSVFFVVAHSQMSVVKLF